jgi:hypothetical protein
LLFFQRTTQKARSSNPTVAIRRTYKTIVKAEAAISDANDDAQKTYTAKTHDSFPVPIGMFLTTN